MIKIPESQDMNWVSVMQKAEPCQVLSIWSMRDGVGDPPSNQATCFSIHRLPASEQPLWKCQLNPLPASLALSTRVCGPALFLGTGKSAETWMRSGEAEKKGAKFSLVERIWRQLFPLWVCVELYKNTMLSSYFSFAYQLGKIPLCIFATCREMDGRVWGKEGGWESCGERKNKNNFCLENVMMSLNSM